MSKSRMNKLLLCPDSWMDVSLTSPIMDPVMAD